MTFSIVARCRRTGDLGMAVTSSSLCVASRCAWTQARTGVVATQNLTDPGLGPLGLTLLGQGRDARQTLHMLLAGDEGRDYRQLQVMDAAGAVVQHTGAQCLPIVASARGNLCAAAGNLLVNTDIPAAMIESFEQGDEQPLATRLLKALQAGLRAGGEIRELRSAGIQVSSHLSWPVVDLRIDGQSQPLEALDALWKSYLPLMPGYISRASAPHVAIV